MSKQNDAPIHVPQIAVATIELIGASPLSWGRYHEAPRIGEETPAAYDDRTWPERFHHDKEGQVIMPPMAVKNMLCEAARYLGLKIPGRRGQTYSKRFERGILVEKPVALGVHLDDLASERLFVPASGKRGDGTRVVRTFPLLQSWGGTCEILVFEPDLITARILYVHAEGAGRFVGAGRFRPERGGHYGRFGIGKFTYGGKVYEPNR